MSTSADTSSSLSDGSVFITDPPFFDNISYAELSDFFYLWLSPLLAPIYPDLLDADETPKDNEAIAAPRFEYPSDHFSGVMTDAIDRISHLSADEWPTTFFYAYKSGGIGWETMIQAIISAGLEIVKTYPLEVEMANRLRALSAESLSVSMLLVCRPRTTNASSATRQEFLAELHGKLEAILPLDLPRPDIKQAAIAAGMEIYSSFGSMDMSIADALTEIDKILADQF